MMATLIPAPICVEVMIDLKQPEDIMRLVEIQANNPETENCIQYLGKKRIAEYFADVEKEYENV